MKPLTMLATLALVTLLMATPALAVSYTITVSTNASSYTGTAAVDVTGTVSPSPGPSQSVFLQVTNPGGQTVPVGAAAVDPTTGAFSGSFNTGGTYFTAMGTYTLTATLGAASGTTTFTYTPATSTSGSGISQTQYKDIIGNITALSTQITALQS